MKSLPGVLAAGFMVNSFEGADSHRSKSQPCDGILNNRFNETPLAALQHLHQVAAFYSQIMLTKELFVMPY